MGDVHSALVKRAVRWLKNTVRCSIALAECGAGDQHEVPDAIGWSPSGRSYVVECKTTLSDFYADRAKPSRRAGNQVGFFRYYFAPAGVLKLELIPEPWGFIELVGGRVMVRKQATPLKHVEQHREVAILVAELSRVTGEWRKPTHKVGVAVDAACERDFPPVDAESDPAFTTGAQP